MQLMESVQPRLVIPNHWGDMFRLLSEPPQPFFSTPRLALPPIQRIDLEVFKCKIRKARPENEVLVPERFKEYFI